MRSKPIAIALVLALAACTDLEPTRTRRSAITGGDPEPGYPAVFSLAFMGQGGCSGTCITSRVGITASHCIEPGDAPNSYSALFGDSETQPTATIGVTAFAKHPTGDIALVAFSQTCPAVLPYNQTALEAHVGEPVVMVGFGVTTEQANDAGIKRSGTATLFSVTPAEVSGMVTGELATSNDPDGTCNGDSGGPTFMRFGGIEYMVGTTSRGSLDPRGQEYPCGQGRSIAVRADSYASFIDDFIGQHDPVMPSPDASVIDADAPDAVLPPADGGAALDAAPPADGGAAADATTATPDSGTSSGADATAGGDSEESGEGCGCSSAPRAPSLTLSWLAALALVMRFAAKARRPRASR